MAAEEQEQTNQEFQDEAGGGKGATAVKAAAAAAATGVAALAAKKALSGRGHDEHAKNGGSPAEKGQSESIFSSMLSGGWDAARDSLLPIAEDAAAAAGEFLAQNAPDVIRERIVPRFIESFNQASGGS
jgi:hypothetical protein